ncbi:uncharacterized protein LOC143026341 isoform X3 [Oratosquilla oratoria]|uniref:uncharacterized protein LOC143026341 isoform X3 n=1 Tax=Oratosquilla oratoria TaxID=337810 RepID=UPI003F76EA54
MLCFSIGGCCRLPKGYRSSAREMSDSEDDSPLKIADNRESERDDEEFNSDSEVLASTSNGQATTKPRLPRSSVVCDSSDEMSGDSDSSDGEDDDEGGGLSDHHEGESDGDSDSSEGPPGAETCAICLGRMRGEVGSPDSCEHVFCIDCILEWAKNNASCPQDRKEFSKVLVRSALQGPVEREVPIDKKDASPIVGVFDENPTFCEVCNCSDREDRMLLCDGCDLGFHLECLTPPLDFVPIEEWFCPTCALSITDTVREVSAAQPSTSQATEGPSSSSSSQRRTSSRRGERLIPRTRATERIRERITQTRKVQRRKLRRKEKRQRQRAKKRMKKRIKSIYEDGNIDNMRKDKRNEAQRIGTALSLYAGVDSDFEPDYADDSYADGILYASNPTLYRPEDRKAHAARTIRESAITPQASYRGRNPALKQLLLPNAASESTDVLSGILENQFVLLSNSKNVSLTDERKLVKRPGISSDASSVFQEEKLSFKEKPLPSRQEKEEPNCSGGSGTQQEEHQTNSRSRSPQRSSQCSPPSRSYRHHSRSPNHRHRSDEESSQCRSSNSEYRSPLDTHRSPLDSDRRAAHSSYQRRPSFSRRDGRHYRRSRSPDWRGRKYDHHRQYNHSPYRNRSPKRRSRSPHRRSRSPKGSSPHSSKSYRSQDRRMWSGDGYDDRSGSKGSPSDRHYRRDRSPGRRDRYHQDRHYRRDRSPYRHDRHFSRKSYNYRRSRSRSRERSGKSDKSFWRRTDSFPGSRSTGESIPQNVGLHSVHTMNTAPPPKIESKSDQHLTKIETSHSSDKSRSGSPMSIDESDDEDRKSVEQLIEEKQKLEKQLEKVELFEQKKRDSSVEKGKTSQSTHAISDDSSDDSDSSSSSDSREEYYSKRSSYSSSSDVKEKSNKRREGSCEQHKDSDKEKAKIKKAKKISSLFGDDQPKSESGAKKGKLKDEKQHRIERRKISLFGEYDDEEAELEIESYSNAKSKSAIVEAELSDSMELPDSPYQQTDKSKRKDDSVKSKSSKSKEKNKDKKALDYSPLSSDYSSDDSIPSSSRKLYDSDFLSDSKSDKSKSYSKSKDTKSKSKSKKWSDVDNPPEESVKTKAISYDKLSSEDSDLSSEFDSRATKEGDRLMKGNMTPPNTDGGSSSRWDEKSRQKGSEIKLNDKLLDIDFKSILSDVQKFKNSKCGTENQISMDLEKLPYETFLDIEEKLDSKQKDKKSNDPKEIKSNVGESRATETNRRSKTEGLYKPDSKVSKTFDVKANRFYDIPSFKDDSSPTRVEKSKKKYDGALKPSTDLFGEIMANVNKNKDRSKPNPSCSSNENMKFAKSPGVDALFGDINDISEDSASLQLPSSVGSPVNNGEPDFMKLKKMNEEMFDSMNFSMLEDRVDTRWKETPKTKNIPQENKKQDITYGTDEEKTQEAVAEDNLRKKEEMENAEEMKRLLNRDHRISDGRRLSSEYSSDEKKGTLSSKKIDYKVPHTKDPETLKKIKQQKAVLEGKVVEEVKKWLDPYYRDKTINRVEYKEIVAKCVNKVVSAECGDVIEPIKMRALVQGYIKVHRYYRSKKENSIIAGGGSGVLSKLDQQLDSNS